MIKSVLCRQVLAQKLVSSIREHRKSEIQIAHLEARPPELGGVEYEQALARWNANAQV